MRERSVIMLMAALAAGCISVPPAEMPGEKARKATASVDSSGLTVVGGNLTLVIPPDALDPGQRITVTIDSIRDTPARHLDEAYLVQPEGQNFNLPVQVIYRYQESMVAGVSDLGALFVGTAIGDGWQPLPEQDSSVAMQIGGRVQHFSVFGLVDPNAPVDAGVNRDGGTRDRSGSDSAASDRRVADANRRDAARTDSAAVSNEIQVQLTWEGASSDLDLHLLRADGSEFSASDDCYFETCKLSAMFPLDWPPTGEVGDPVMDVDDVQGYGPENVTLAVPTNETYVVGVHLYDPHTDTLPISYTVKIYWRSNLVFNQTRSVTRCDDYVDVANVAVSNSGNTVLATPRGDSPAPAGRGACTGGDQ